MPPKPPYDPKKHHRRSIRLKGYDYSQPGSYFITICIQDREMLLGQIINGEMQLNKAGQMIDKWWQKIPEKFSDIELGEYQIMPNHFHAIVINVGVDPCAEPENQNENDQSLSNINKHSNELLNEHIADVSIGNEGEHIGETGNVSIGDEGEHMGETGNVSIGDEGEHMGSPLHGVVQWFKTMSTNEYIRNVKQNDWPSFNGKLWQRNYFEHIIRNQKSFQRIAAYIYNNPVNWQNDNLYKE